MNPKFNLLGKVFGRLKVVKFVGRAKDRQYLWECECSCEQHTHSVVCHQLTPGDVFTMSATKLAYCLMTNQININYFKVIRVYNRRFIPKQWYKKLMFWQWIKMVDLVDIEFVGS